jgi:hypothetical protein
MAEAVSAKGIIGGVRRNPRKFRGATFRSFLARTFRSLSEKGKVLGAAPRQIGLEAAQVGPSQAS